MLTLLTLLLLQSSPPAYWTDGTLLVPGIMEMDRRHDPAFEATGFAAKDNGHEVGDQINFWSIDHSQSIPRFYLTTATCRFVGSKT